jgi:2-polyprenyl-3-methyl-5-hydroxy-6-metoxy-1,4-benzoquinol methylase
MEPKGQELIERYRENYKIAKDALLTEEMILQHWELEKKLTQEMLKSAPNDRWETFERCYTTLYSELEWLNRLTNSEKKAENLDRKYANWIQLIGTPPQKIYEVGSGKGELIGYLASQGYDCRATEVSRERGKKWTDDLPNLSWGISDGVHLERFEPENHYDVVISNQVIEHLHPDDLVDHFRGVLKILVPGGRYIFCTPHSHQGPSDVSWVFKCQKPIGMHLKEYTYGELTQKLKQAGYQSIYTQMPNIRKLRRILGERYQSSSANTIYLNCLYSLENLIKILPNQEQRRKTFYKIARSLRFSTNILLVAQKATSEN